MTGRYPIPAAPREHEIEIRRSRFRAIVGPAPSVEEAKAFVDEVRARHAGATHNCWAFLVGPPGSSDRVGCSDDGEPSGTAGRPILNVLAHCGLGDVVAVVTRWYGGTKLGAGGLVRAYTEAVQEVLARTPAAERIDWETITVEIDYAAVDPVRRLLPEYEAAVIDEAWGVRAALTVKLPAEHRAAFAARVTDATNGTARLA